MIQVDVPLPYDADADYDRERERLITLWTFKYIDDCKWEKDLRTLTFNNDMTATIFKLIFGL